jgi:hypothetical protein
VLTPRAIPKAEQAVDTGPAELNENFLHPLPLAIEQRRKPGAPKGNRNRFVHGKYSGEVFAFRADVRAHIRQARMLLTATRKLMRGDPESAAGLGDISGVPGNAG